MLFLRVISRSLNRPAQNPGIVQTKGCPSWHGLRNAFIELDAIDSEMIRSMAMYYAQIPRGSSFKGRH
jgi:hypothetical protein